MGSWTTFIKGGVLCYSFVFMLIRSTGLTLVYFAHDSEVKKPNEYRNKRILNSSAVMKEVYGFMVYANDENLWRSQLKHCNRIFPKINPFSLYIPHTFYREVKLTDCSVWRDSKHMGKPHFCFFS